MNERVRYVTGETEKGRAAIQEVVQHSYAADIDSVPAPWARARVVSDVPVSFILVDPGKQMEFPGGDVTYAFVCDTGTREDRRGEGHFQSIMEHTFSSLRESGIALAVTHGRYQLYRQFGFDVFTHHSGIFITPECIERVLGTQFSEEAKQLLVVEDRQAIQEDLLLVSEVKAESLPECDAALQAAAALARRRGKARILFEHPPAPSYGSHYPIYQSLESPLVTLARTCGAQVCLQGADPEGGSIPDADWVKVLDARALVREVLRCRKGQDRPLPKVIVSFDTEAGPVTVEAMDDQVTASAEVRPKAATVKWPSSALAQLVIGYRSAAILSTIHETPFSPEVMALLNELFPPRWRFSRNESWTYGR